MVEEKLPPLNNLEFSQEYEKCKKNPYGYILDWADSVLLFVGKKIFSILSLVPPSLILPNIPSNKIIRSNINLLYISPPSSGKSSICQKFENMAYYPLRRRVISSSELQVKAVDMKLLTLIIEDFSQTAEQGYEIIKTIEGIIEDQRVDKSNMRVELLEDVKGSALLCGTPQDLETYASLMERGLMSRCLLMYFFLTSKQHSEIGSHVNNAIGNEAHTKKINLREEVVLQYYRELREIQEGKHKNIRPIIKYGLDSHKSKIYAEWQRISEKLIQNSDGTYWIRDLEDGYRIMISSAFLNIFNRKFENGTLYPNEEDAQIAIQIMKNNMKYKYILMQSLKINKQLKNADALIKFLSKDNNDNSVKNILLNISPYGNYARAKGITEIGG